MRCNQRVRQFAAIAKVLGEDSCDEPETAYLQQLKLRVEQVIERYRVNMDDLKRKRAQAALHAVWHRNDLLANFPIAY